MEVWTVLRLTIATAACFAMFVFMDNSNNNNNIA